MHSASVLSLLVYVIVPEVVATERYSTINKTILSRRRRRRRHRPPPELQGHPVEALEKRVTTTGRELKIKQAKTNTTARNRENKQV